MSYNEKIFHLLMMVLILFSAPSYLNRLIPVLLGDYFDYRTIQHIKWFMKLSSWAVRYVVPWFVIYFFLYKKKVYLWFGIINLLLLPQAIADSGLLWDDLLKPFFNISNIYDFLEHTIDDILTYLIAIGNMFLFIYTFLEFKRELKKERL